MGTTVGILGGGQLARMLALAGAPLGLRFLVMDNAEDACAAQFVPQLRADYGDPAALEDFARRVDVATFDFENVPSTSAEWLAGRIPVFPGSRALAVAQDRVAEKQLFTSLGIGVPAFAAVDSEAALQEAVSTLGLPCILKTRRLGYDGKGQFRLRTRDDVAAAWAALGPQAARVGLVAEAFVDFEREVSVLAVRGRDGGFRTWAVTENWHEDGILSASMAPALVPVPLAARAVGYARSVAEALDYVGVFALEMFVHRGALLANEMAPRVHNSGHWTIEGAETSQFENHLRAVLGLPLGSTACIGSSVMLNWVGSLPDPATVLSAPGGHWHDYGKSPREGRKLGHATLRGDDAGALAARLRGIGRSLGRDAQVEAAAARLESAMAPAGAEA